MNARVLIIEDERELAELIEMYLQREGIETSIAGSAEEGERLLQEHTFDLITLDINLPGKDGFEFLQLIRRDLHIPVVMVSAREADEDVIMGLGIGADEFVTKPFAPRVLSARIRALLRRARESEKRGEIIQFSGYSLDVEGYVVTRGSERVNLSAKEFEVLAFLAANPGIAYSTDDIYRAVWGDSYGDITTVGVYIQRLRKKIEEDPRNPRILETVHGKGYRFSREMLEKK